MVFIKVKRDTAGGLNYLNHAVNYVEDDEKAIFLGGCGVSQINTDHSYAQMLAVRRYFGKVSGNPLMHFIVSFDEKVRTANEAILITEQLTRFFCNRYQVLWCVHFKQRGCSNFHAHILLNSVSYQDGKMYHSSCGEIEQFAEYVRTVTKNDVYWYFAQNERPVDAGR